MLPMIGSQPSRQQPVRSTRGVTLSFSPVDVWDQHAELRRIEEDRRQIERVSRDSRIDADSESESESESDSQSTSPTNSSTMNPQSFLASDDVLAPPPRDPIDSIQPREANDMEDPDTNNGNGSATDADAPPKRRRGRPSKSDVENERRWYAERGQEPPAPSMKKKHDSAPMIYGPDGQPMRKKRGRKSKAELAAMAATQQFHPLFQSLSPIVVTTTQGQAQGSEDSGRQSSSPSSPSLPQSSTTPTITHTDGVDERDWYTVETLIDRLPSYTAVTTFMTRMAARSRSRIKAIKELRERDRQPTQTPAQSQSPFDSINGGGGSAAPAPSTA